MEATKTVEIPPPQFPMLVLLITDSIEGSGMTKWIVSEKHPYVPDLSVMRMFNDRGGIEIYSASSDAKSCIRDFVPMARVRLSQEAMPVDVYVDELRAAELGDGDEEEDESVEPEPDEPSTEAPSNGQVAP